MTYLIKVCRDCNRQCFDDENWCAGCKSYNVHSIEVVERTRPMFTASAAALTAQEPVATGGYVRLGANLSESARNALRRSNDNDIEDWLKERFPWLNTSS